MHRVRIGYVKFLNTLPLVEGLAAWRDADLQAAVPSKLAAMLLGHPPGHPPGQQPGSPANTPTLDLALASVIDAAKAGRAPGGQPRIALLPCGMIGCDGPTLTVRIFSAVPLDQVTVLHADTDSHTSVALAQILLSRLHNRRPTVVDYDAREKVSNGRPEEWPETVLLIGDKVVTDSPPAIRYPHQMDLGEAWKRYTGLPFVYATWMCRAADLAEPLSPLGRAILTAAAVLDRQRRRNTQRTEWIIERYSTDRYWPEDLARRYVTELLRYQVTDRDRQAVDRFFTEAAALGLVPADAAAQWADPPAAPAPTLPALPSATDGGW
ncbi:MAG: hypothetical protein LW650_08715 [Planctomycetaceae bacterium]|jgi:chorismate dehydratase|nr:hypothetical protein [Phycisphaerales bacterium]MCE2653562.1 hypothetical protein [Planctomycetaceae bacterium]